MSLKPSKTKSLNRTTTSILALLLLAGLGFAQETSVDYFQWRTNNNSEIDPDRIALRTISPAYVARFYENYVTWWQADILALSTVALWEVKDGLVPEEKAGFMGGQGFSSEDLIFGAIGIGLNRVLPIIVKQGRKLIRFPATDRMAVSINNTGYAKLALSVKL